MNEPSQEVIDRLKAQFSTRSLHRVEFSTAAGESTELDPVVLIMTGPSVVEYEKFLEDIDRASKVKDDLDKGKAYRTVVQNNALAQIKWPDRDEAIALFAQYPAISLNLAQQLHNTAGASFEVRSKKL